MGYRQELFVDHFINVVRDYLGSDNAVILDLILISALKNYPLKDDRFVPNFAGESNQIRANRSIERALS